MQPKHMLKMVVVASCLAMSAAIARAQTPSPISPSSIGRGQPTRVNIQFRIDIEGDPADPAAAEKARKALYGQMAKECSILAANFPSVNCLLENMNIMVQRDSPMSRNTSFLSGNAVYQLRAE